MLAGFLRCCLNFIREVLEEGRILARESVMLRCYPEPRRFPAIIGLIYREVVVSRANFRTEHRADAR